MVERILELKGFVNESVEVYNKNLQLTAPQWRQAQQLKDLLKKSFEVTKKLQLDDLTPGYFYRKWIGLRNVFQVQGSLIAEDILSSMKMREGDLLNNPFFLAAVYMDPFHDKLSTEQRETAKGAVLQLVLKITGLDSLAAEDSSEAEMISVSADDSDSDEEMRSAKNKTAENIRIRALSDEFTDSDQETEVRLADISAASSSGPTPKKKKELTPQVSIQSISTGTVLETMTPTEY